jgi:hypothetical protein
MTAYEIAVAAHNQAQEVFAVARAKFFAVPGIAAKSDYQEFAIAQAAKKVADAAFDVAFEIEMNREEPEVTEDDGQADLF